MHKSEHKSDDLVSIVITYYNLGKYIEETISCILKQTYKNTEIILVNDGSTDRDSIRKLDTLKIKYKEKITFIDQSNKGLSAARNIGISSSKGKFICCMDADDKINPKYIEELHKAIIFDSGVGIASSWVRLFGKETGIWKTSKMILSTSLVRNSLCGSSLFLKKCWTEVGGYDEKMHDGYEDWDIWISISKLGYKSQIVPKPLFMYRIRKNSMLTSANTKRLKIMKYLYKKHHDLVKLYSLELILSQEMDLIYHRNLLQTDNEKLKNLTSQNQKLKVFLKKNNIDENDLDYIYKRYYDLENKIRDIETSFSWRLITAIRTKVLDKIISNRSILRKKIVKPVRYLKDKVKSLMFRSHTLTPTIKINYLQKSYPTDKPLISVVVVCYNYGQYVTDAVNSVLNQTFQDFEIIIVESNSIDNSREVINKFNDRRIKKYFRKERHLAGDNRNYGIQKSSGKYICCLDADDMIKPTYLEKAVFLLETENYDLVSTSIESIGSENKIYDEITRPTLADMIYANHVSTVAVFKRTLFEKTGGYHDWGLGEIHVPEDWDLWMKMSAFGARIFNIYEPLMLYRMHGLSLSNDVKCKTRDAQRLEIINNNQKLINNFNLLRSSMFNKFLRYNVADKYINIVRKKIKKEVLFALPYTVLGGADKIFLNLLKVLKEKSISGIISTTVHFDNSLHDTTNDYSEETGNIYHLTRFVPDNSSKYDFIKYLIKKYSIDVIFIGGSQFYYDLLPDIKKNFPNIKVIDIQFNTDVHFKNCTKYIKYIDHIIAENQEVYDKYTIEKNISKNTISLISYGVETDRFIPVQSSTRPSPIPENKFLISFLGRQSPEKNPEFMIKLAGKYKNNHKLFFILAGPGPLFENLKNKIEELGLKNIYMPGSINSLEYLSFTDLLILPSIIDGNPIVIKEAFSMGIPVVASNIGGVPYLVKNNETGFICDINSLPQFSQAIDKVVSSPKLLQQMKKNCREYAIKNLDLKVVNEKFLSVFNKYIK